MGPEIAGVIQGITGNEGLRRQMQTIHLLQKW